MTTGDIYSETFLFFMGFGLDGEWFCFIANAFFSTRAVVDDIG